MHTSAFFLQVCLVLFFPNKKCFHEVQINALVNQMQLPAKYSRKALRTVSRKATRTVRREETRTVSRKATRTNFGLTPSHIWVSGTTVF